MNTAGHRQRQAAQGYAHLPPLKRPHYKVRSLEDSRKHEARVRATAQRIAQGSKKR